MVTNIEKPLPHCFAHSAENIAIVNESVAEDLKVFIPRHSQELESSCGTLRRILHLNLHQHPYKVQLTQQLKLVHHSQRRKYVEWVLDQQAMDGNFSNKFQSSYLHKKKIQICRAVKLVITTLRSGLRSSF